MYCNGINCILIVVSLIIMMNMKILVTSQQYRKLQKRHRNTNQKVFLLDEGTNGDLYDIFQKRLQVIQNELSYHKLKDLDQLSAKVKEKQRRLSDKSGKTGTFNNENTKLKDKKFEYLNEKKYEKENFRKIGDVLFQNPNVLNFSTTRDELYQEFQNQLKSINSVMTSKEKRDYRWAAPYHNKNYNYYDEIWLEDGENYDNLDWEYENSNNYKLWNSLPQKATYSNLHRRQVISNNTSLYPSVLTKAVEISLYPTVHANSSGGLLANVAQKMNTSTLDLAEKLAKSTDNSQNNDQFTQMVQHFMTNNGGNIAANSRKSVSSQIISDIPIKITNSPRPIIVQKVPISSPVQIQSSEILQGYTETEGNTNGITTSSLTAILDRVLSKLDSIHDDKNKNEEEHPNGAPCDITGSWSSLTLGLCFDIQYNKDKVRNVSPAEVNNKILSIEAQECTPPKSHHIIDLEWKFGGSAFKQLGGPFYIYSQKRSESLVGTFLGYCRTCAGIDTIFGSWTFLSPSKDCQDISLAFNVKRDLLRRVRMEIKRKERFKDLLYQNRIENT